VVSVIVSRGGTEIQPSLEPWQQLVVARSVGACRASLIATPPTLGVGRAANMGGEATAGMNIAMAEGSRSSLLVHKRRQNTLQKDEQ
jgi:hypothetical protein